MLKFKNILFNKQGKSLFVSIFILAMVLRFLLAAVNSESNDYHFDVISMIMDENKIPGFDECPECFQPKLFHLSMAGILKILPIDSLSVQIRIVQLINCIAGGITLYFVYLFISTLAFANRIKIISFALIALNPKFIGINAQATNDSLVILFSTICLYYLLQFFQGGNLKSFLLMSGSAILAVLTKGNGLVLFPVILTVFFTSMLFFRKNSQISIPRQLLLLLTFSFIYFLSVPFLGQYYEKYKKTGSPFTINQDKDPAPHFIKQTFIKKPGVTSVVDSYFTFRFIDLLKNPLISNDSVNYPLHRTSLWTQLYGRTFSAHFDMWPHSWQTNSNVVKFIGRCIFILALIPFLFLIVGSIKILRSVVIDFIRIIKYRNKIEFNTSWIYFTIIMAYVLFIIAYSFQYRDYSTMKAIFIFPGLLAFLFAIMFGMDYIYKRFTNNRKLMYSLNISLFSLLTLYCADVAYLIIQLSVIVAGKLV